MKLPWEGCLFRRFSEAKVPFLRFDWTVVHRALTGFGIWLMLGGFASFQRTLHHRPLHSLAAGFTAMAMGNFGPCHG